MELDINTTRPIDIVREMFGGGGSFDAYSIDNVEMTTTGERHEIRFSASSVNSDISECFGPGEVLAECEINPDGDDLYRNLVIARYDELVLDHVAIVDALHSCGQYNDDDYTGYVTGLVHVVPADHADEVIENAMALVERRSADSIADALVALLRRMESLDDTGFASARLQDALRGTMRHMAKRV